MIELLDTTLRDGAQAEGISFSLTDKLQIVRALDELGIRWIEAGNPAANPMDAALFDALSNERPLCNASLVAFGSTCHPHAQPESDSSMKILSDCHAEIKAIFGKSSLFQIKNVLRCSADENLRIIRESISFLRRNGNTVWFDAEHFFDGFRENRDYAMLTLEEAIQAGASRIILCDTRGASFPEEISETVKFVRSSLSVPIGIHCHNDSGLAVACSVAAVRAGCDHIQGTIGGIGERCGNTNLCTIAPLLTLRMNLQCLPGNHLNRLTHLSRQISEIMNIVPDENAPFVGYAAFSHKAGMHIDAIVKNPASYELIDPEAVGNQRRFLLSDQAGRSGVYAHLGKLLPDLNRDSPEIRQVIEKLKEMESLGYTYENADGSFELLALDTLGRRPRFFEVVDYHVLCQPASPGVLVGEKTPSAQAYLKVNVAGRVGINAAEGDGPVNALDLALRKTLSLFYPSLTHMSLQDFKVRVLNTQGTASLVRVSIESTDGTHIWNTVGVSDNIIEASLRSLIDSVDYMLTNYVHKEEILSVSSGMRDDSLPEIR